MASSNDRIGPAGIRRAAASHLSGHTIWPQQRQMETPGGVAVERRSDVRYPLGLPVTFRSLDKPNLSGEGQVLNISSGGVFVTYPKQLDLGSRVELRISWPFLLDRRIPLQFFALGKVARCAPTGFAVIFRQYQFRTTGERPRQFTYLVAKAGR